MKCGMQGQLVMVGVEWGLPYNLASSLANPLGPALASLSLGALAVTFLLALVRGALALFHLETGGRRRREVGWADLSSFLDLEHGFSYLQVPRLPGPD